VSVIVGRAVFSRSVAKAMARPAMAFFVRRRLIEACRIDEHGRGR
jgi:hypothetical protein